MGLNWLEQSRDPSSEKKQRQCKRDRTESKLKSCEVAGGKELSYGGNETTTNAEPDNSSHSASSFHFPKLPVDTKVFASKLLKKFRAFLFASFAFPSISIQPPASTLFLSPVYSPDSRRSAILWYRPGGLTRSKTRLKNLDRALQSLLVVMSQI